MVAVKLLREPGYIYDLDFIFCLKFNYNYYLKLLPQDNQKDDRIKFFDTILKSFGDVPDDLFVFFHSFDGGRSFLSDTYIIPCKEYFTTKFNFKFLLEQLRDVDALTRKLIAFYFSDFTKDEIDLCLESNAALFERIKKSGYSNEEKSKLYEFFIDPASYVQLLRSELIEKEHALELYYEKNYQKIFDVFNETTFESIANEVDGLDDLSFLKENDQVLYTSYCLLNVFTIYCINIAEGALYLLGCEYSSILDHVKDLRKEPSLDVFGNALAEENRMKILQHLLIQEECTCKNFEKVFNFSGSTVYHHVTILLRSGVLKTRNEGKTIFYSINRDHFDNVIKALKKYSNSH